MEEVKQIKGQPKSFLKKLKENVDDHEEQMAILGAAVRLGVVIWSGFIITLSYVELPMICLLYTSPSPRDGLLSRMPSSA